MDIYEMLQKYKDYSFHKTAEKVEIKYMDTAFRDLTFTGYDLNNTEFLEVSFQQCDFTDVYLSGSNLSGSMFRQCIFCGNIFRKGQADCASFIQTNIKNLNAFRTSFYKAQFRDLTIEGSKINRCFMKEAVFERVVFKAADISNTNFRHTYFRDVKLVECVIGESIFENVYGLEKVEFINCSNAAD